MVWVCVCGSGGGGGGGKPQDTQPTGGVICVPQGRSGQVRDIVQVQPRGGCALPSGLDVPISACRNLSVQQALVLSAREGRVAEPIGSVGRAELADQLVLLYRTHFSLLRGR